MIFFSLFTISVFSPLLLIWSCIFYTSYQCHVWIHILSVLIFLFLLVSMFHILSKSLILVFLMEIFTLFSGLSCLPFFCQHSASYLVSLWNSQELQFSRSSPEILQCLTYSLFFPWEVIKYFIKMQKPCKDWKRVGQNIQLSILWKNRHFPYQLHWDLAARDHLQEGLWCWTLFLFVLRPWTHKPFSQNCGEYCLILMLLILQR